jgi:hypothetical protein
MELIIGSINNKLDSIISLSLDSFLEDYTPLPTSIFLSYCRDSVMKLFWMQIVSTLCDYRHYPVKHRPLFDSFILELQNHTTTERGVQMVYEICDPERDRTLYDLQTDTYENRLHISKLLAKETGQFSTLVFISQGHILTVIEDIGTFDTCQSLYTAYMKEISTIPE